MYKLRLSRREKRKLFRAETFIVLLAVVGLLLIVWLAWLRPIHMQASIESFDDCVKAGNPIQESYPEVCLTSEGGRFVNPKQQQAHQASLTNQEKLSPPSDPALLNLDIDEWDVRVPLSNETFDLAYAYVESGGEEYVVFTFKRLIQMDVCKGDVGVRFSRSVVKNEPPYTSNKPAAVGQVDKFYLYAFPSDQLCYDDKNADQAALVKQIAGEQSLVQATIGLVAKSVAIPKE